MRTIALVGFCALLAATAQAGELGTITCPISSRVNIGCLCTFGCSVNGDTTDFPWNAPVFPPQLIPADQMGNDTICAKVTIPAVAAAAARNLTGYLGVSGNITTQTAGGSLYNGVADNSEVTVWTAFTAAECQGFVARVNALTSAVPAAKALNVELCSSESCNVVNRPVRAATNSTPTNQETLLPGACPKSNANPTGCYCSNGCSVNGDKVFFPWKPTAWQPVAVSAADVGNDTICARITIPNINAPAYRNLSAYLGVNGDIHFNGSSYFGAAYGQTLTVYTAFTQEECDNFVAVVTAADPIRGLDTSVKLCNTSNCNSISSFDSTGSGGSLSSPSSASPLSWSLAVAAAFAAVLFLM